jgi:hypothetical protein
MQSVSLGENYARVECEPLTMLKQRTINVIRQGSDNLCDRSARPLAKASANFLA